jgi:dephospho-CoA kinase
VIKDGSEVNFKELAFKVFSSEENLNKINSLMFPEIKKEVESIVENIRKNKKIKYLIIDAAVLFDSGIYSLCDFIILVKSSLKKRCRLLMEKNSMDYGEAMFRLKGQRINIKRKFLACTLSNTGDKKKLEDEIGEIAHMITGLSAGK